MNGVRRIDYFYLICLIVAIILLFPGCASSTGQANPEQPSTGAEPDQARQETPPAGDQAAKAPEKQPATGTSGVPFWLSSATASSQTPPQLREVTLGDGTQIVVRTASRISTKTNQPGQVFYATLEQPIVEDDWVIARKGAEIEGMLTECDPGGRVQGVARLAVQLRKLELADGRTVDIQTSVIRRQARTTKKKDAQKIGIGAGVGGAIGAIAGGGKGAAIGAVVGGGAGSGVVMATHGEPATIASETRLTFTLIEPIRIVEQM
jgi:hypothetical protein